MPRLVLDQVAKIRAPRLGTVVALQVVVVLKIVVDAASRHRVASCCHVCMPLPHLQAVAAAKAVVASRAVDESANVAVYGSPLMVTT